MPLINGTNILVYDGDVALGHSVNATLSLNVDVSSTTNKNSGGWYECLGGKRVATIRVEGLVDYSDQLNYRQLVDYIITRKQSKWVFKGSSMFYFGAGQIVSVEEVAGDETSVSFSVEIQINGRVYFEPRLPWNLVFSNWENININWENV